jgi:hypothetical protein
VDDGSDGRVTSTALASAHDRLRALGQYEVSDVVGTWSATTETRAGDAQKKLNEDLDRVAGNAEPGSVVRTHQTIATNAARVAAELWRKYQHVPLIECLLGH